MRANRSDAVIGGMLVFLGVFVLVATRSFPPRTHLYVNLVSISLIISAALLTVKAVYAELQPGDEKEQCTVTQEKPVVWLFVLANMAFVGAVYLMGFHVAAFLFLLGGPIILGQRNILISLLVSCCLVGCLYLIFVIFLKVPLPKGIFWG